MSASVMRVRHRPGVHFSASRNWLNDPNGLVWYDGEYHLFFQHNPEGIGWGNMSWGHAVSQDLVTWTELPLALEHTPTEHVFSGSVVVDHANTSGLGRPGAPAMVALYTVHHPVTGQQAQALAWSTDRGRTWTRYAANPVLDIGATAFRDPKVFWYDPGACWVMAVALAEDHVIRFYGSSDLTSWTPLSDFTCPGSDDGLWECPDLFELPVDGDWRRSRWVLVFSVDGKDTHGWSGTLYVVGSFDGTRFTPDDPGKAPVRLDAGADCYAAVSFTDAPDGERVLLGWMNNWAYAAHTPATDFRGAMTFPRSVSLSEVAGELRLLQRPVAVPDSCRETAYSHRGPLPPGITRLPEDAGGEVLEIRLVLDPGTARRAGLHVHVGAEERTVVGYDAAARSVYVDRTRSGDVGFAPTFPAVHHALLEPGSDGRVRLTVIVDRSSVEVFCGSGEQVITDQVFPSDDSTRVALFAEGGRAAVVDLTVTRLSGPRLTAGTHPRDHQ